MTDSINTSCIILSSLSLFLPQSLSPCLSLSLSLVGHGGGEVILEVHVQYGDELLVALFRQPAHDGHLTQKYTPNRQGDLATPTRHTHHSIEHGFSVHVTVAGEYGKEAVKGVLEELHNLPSVDGHHVPQDGRQLVEFLRTPLQQMQHLNWLGTTSRGKKA